MAKGIYVGVESVARKVKKAYVGVDDVARKVKKGYIGVNGIARLFYSSIDIITFNSNIFPTSWINSEDYSKATTTNEYGEWQAEKGSHIDTTNPVSNVFDNNADTYVASTSGQSARTVDIILPNNVLICPYSFSVTYSICHSNSYIYGYDPDSGEWVNIGSYGSSSNRTKATVTVNVSSNNQKYYSKFRINMARYNSTYQYSNIFEFQCTSGQLKVT